MPRTNLASRLRHQLCDLFTEVGPDASTLCEGWTTRDLAAHLVVRETRPDAAAGILVKAAASYGDKIRRRVADRPWPELVDAVRTGPPRLSPMRLRPLDDLTNTIEFFVHREDVRRAGNVAVSTPAEPDVDAALGRMLARGARLLTRSSPVGLTLILPDRDPIVAKKGEPVVNVIGSASEIVLFLYGRSSVAHVDFDGPADAVERLKATKFGV